MNKAAGTRDQINYESSAFDPDRRGQPEWGAGLPWEDSVASTPGHRPFPGTDGGALAFNGTDNLRADDRMV